MSVQMFFVDHHGRTFQADDPSKAALRKAFRESTSEHQPYAVELVQRERKARDTQS